MVVGITLIGATWLVYENEEREIQSKLENLWIRLSDLSSSAYSMHRGASAKMLRAISALIDLTFGPKLVSLRFLAASLSISYIGLLLSPDSLTVLGYSSGETVPARTSLISSAIMIVLCFWIGAIRRTRHLLVCIGATLICSLGMGFALYFDNKGSSEESPWFLFAVVMIVSVLASVSADATTLWSIRVIAKKGGRATGIRALVVMLCGGLTALVVMAASAAIFFSPFLMIGGMGGGAAAGMGLDELISMNAADLLSLLVIVLIAVALSVHSAAWPLILRPLYGLQSPGWEKSKSCIRKLGVAALAFGVALHPKVAHMLSELSSLPPFGK